MVSSHFFKKSTLFLSARLCYTLTKKEVMIYNKIENEKHYQLLFGTQARQ